MGVTPSRRESICVTTNMTHPGPELNKKGASRGSKIRSVPANRQRNAEKARIMPGPPAFPRRHNSKRCRPAARQPLRLGCGSWIGDWTGTARGERARIRLGVADLQQVSLSERVESTGSVDPIGRQEHSEQGRIRLRLGRGLNRGMTNEEFRSAQQKEPVHVPPYSNHHCPALCDISCSTFDIRFMRQCRRPAAEHSDDHGRRLGMDGPSLPRKPDCGE